jgi:hypothetical protein
MILAQEIAVVAADPAVAGGRTPMLAEGLRILGAEPASPPVLAHCGVHRQAPIRIDGVLRMRQDRSRETKLTYSSCW